MSLGEKSTDGISFIVATAASRDDGSSRLLVLLLPTEATAERHFLKELEENNVARIKSCILLS